MGDALVGQIAFGPFGMDLDGARLMRDGCDLELRPQAFHALRTLIQNCGKHVDYEQMIHQAWEGVSVSRHTVAVTVGEAKEGSAGIRLLDSLPPQVGIPAGDPSSRCADPQRLAFRQARYTRRVGESA
jgi:hypothetical protein